MVNTWINCFVLIPLIWSIGSMPNAIEKEKKKKEKHLNLERR